MTEITVRMAGIPQGSHKAFIVKTKSGMNRAVVTNSNKASLYEERIAIAEEYTHAEGERYDSKTPIALTIEFGYIKPKSKPKKVKHMTVKPDIDKLTRAVLDALTGVAYEDDSQVVSLDVRKIYSESEYIKIGVNVYEDV